MPKVYKLSWQPGSGNRPGRWKKFYKGKTYFFPAGSGKADRDAYDRAWLLWEAKKREVDATTPRRYQQEYERCIAEWELVLAWSNRHGDKEHAGRAEHMLGVLRHRFAQPKLRPLTWHDRFEAEFEPCPPEVLADIGRMVHETLYPPSAPDGQGLPLGEALLSLLPPDEAAVAEQRRTVEAMDGSPERIAREIWRDRLTTLKRGAVSEDKSVGGYVKVFLAQKESQAAAGEVSAGRVYALRLHLEHFRDWLGRQTEVTEIDGAILLRYYSHLLDKLRSRAWKRRTAGHYLTTVKSFVRWLWQTEALAVLPRIMDGRSTILAITKPAPQVVVFTKEEIRALLTKATDRVKLYVLLMLNCGLTQKDISDLKVAEVDWDAGRIIRRRSKTKDEEHVPIVNYKLWNETFRLLQQERAADSKDRVLLNANGSPLLFEELTTEGKYRKNDNVKNAFDRLRTNVDIDKPLKSLKKSSATLLRGSAKFSALEGLFLGHAPQSMSDRHYTQVPQKLLDQAVVWLGKEYGIV